MNKKERQKLILNEVHLHNRVLINDLARKLHVSSDTIRRDIIELDKDGKLIRVHGGAQAVGFQLYNYNAREIFFHEEKMKIAAKAIALVATGSVSLISGGTTNLEFARSLPEDLQATFFTPSLPVAMQLLTKPLIEVIFIGGRLSHSSQIALGGNALISLADIKFDNCFIGTSYLDDDRGITEFDWDVVQLKKAMIAASDNIISLTLSQKLGSTQRYKVCNANDIDILVTELEPTHPILSPYQNQGIEII